MQGFIRIQLFERRRLRNETRMEKTELYLVLLRCCLAGDGEGGTPTITQLREVNWHDLLEFSKKQTTVTTYWNGIQRWFKEGVSPIKASAKEIEEVRPTGDDIMEWMATRRRIELAIKKVNDRSVWATEQFRKEGFRTCILKGQGNSLYFPKEILRQPGDIDIWVEGGDKKVLAYIDSIRPNMKRCYHHVKFIKTHGVDIEVHYRPTWLNSWWYNRRLQRFFDKHANEQFANSAVLPDTDGGTICVPTQEFNIYYQLCHIYRHLLQDGIGIRHLLDYYFLLKSGTTFSNEQRAEITRQLKHLGLYRVARSVMWALKEVLGLSDEYLIAEPDEKLGRVLMNEVLYQERLDKSKEKSTNEVQTLGWKHNLQRIMRDIHMMWYFPSECIWEPIFRVYHFWWRFVH